MSKKLCLIVVLKLYIHSSVIIENKVLILDLRARAADIIIIDPTFIEFYPRFETLVTYTVF